LSPFKGRSVFSAWVRMLELPNLKASSMTEAKRVPRAVGNTSQKLLPTTSRALLPETRAIQSFQEAIERFSSRTMMPMSTASKAGPYSKLLTLSGIRLLLAQVGNIVPHDVFQNVDGRQVHQERDEAADVAVFDCEVDIEKQHQIFVRVRAF